MRFGVDTSLISSRQLAVTRSQFTELNSPVKTAQKICTPTPHSTHPQPLLYIISYPSLESSEDWDGANPERVGSDVVKRGKGAMPLSSSCAPTLVEFA